MFTRIYQRNMVVRTLGIRTSANIIRLVANFVSHRDTTFSHILPLLYHLSGCFQPMSPPLSLRNKFSPHLFQKCGYQNKKLFFLFFFNPNTIRFLLLSFSAATILSPSSTFYCCRLYHLHCSFAVLLHCSSVSLTRLHRGLHCPSTVILSNFSSGILWP